MKLYYHPISTTCRPIVLFAAEQKIDIDYQLVDLFTGEHVKPEYASINPNHLIPVLEDGDFRLTESSAILKYLAEKSGSKAYPSDLRKRAKVNEMMDWLNTQFYRDWAYGMIYPQLFPNLKRPTEEQHQGVIAWGKEKAANWLKILDRDLIGAKNAYLCGSEITLADYLGAPYVTIGEIVRCDFSGYPNINRWLGNMKALPSWSKVNKAFNDLAASVKDAPFVAI
ncbi:MAG TPA: glutathione S-transferase family protein [Burkholderiales bacterium]|nr:glutathione S-transferase family protein [Burkholderiales bacterium]